MNGTVVFTIFFVVFLGLLLLGGLISRRWVKESGDFILAGREVSTWINIMGVCAIGFAGTAIVLGPGFSILGGFKTSMAFSFFYTICGLALFGVLYSNFIRRSGAQTLPEFLEMRYSPNVRKLIAIPSIIGMCGILANNIVACVQSVVGFTGWSMPVVMAIVFVIIITFTFLSGLWAATINDFIQVVIGAIAVPIFMFMLISRFGGFDTLAANWAGNDWVNAGLNNYVTPGLKLTYPSYLNFIICFAAALVWGNNYYWMKVASCRSEKIARKSFVAAGIILFVVFFLPLAIIGSYAGGFFGTAFVQGGGRLPYTAAYGYLAGPVAGIFVPLLGSFFVTGAIAASMSTASTAALGASAVATRDVYLRIINPKADAKHALRASKLAMIIIGGVTFLLCLFPGGPTYLFAFANSWLVPPAILIALGVLWPKFNKQGAFVGALVGMIVMALFTLLSLTGVFVIDRFIYLASLGFVVTLVVALVASFFGQPPYFGKPGWERVPNSTNREDIKLEEFDKKVLGLISIGHCYMADVTDTMGVDSSTSAASIERLDRGGYIVRKGLNRSNFYSFEITEKGLAAVPDSEKTEPKLREAKLKRLYVDLLVIVKNSPEKQLEFIKTNNIKSMHMAAISSHLTRQGYIVEKGLFKRQLHITEKGLKAIAEFA